MIKGLKILYLGWPHLDFRSPTSSMIGGALSGPYGLSQIDSCARHPQMSTSHCIIIKIHIFNSLIVIQPGEELRGI